MVYNFIYHFSFYIERILLCTNLKISVYCYKGTNVLVNKMNIKDPIALKNYETSVIGLKLMALSKQGITGKFDVSHFDEYS